MIAPKKATKEKHGTPKGDSSACESDFVMLMELYVWLARRSQLRQGPNKFSVECTETDGRSSADLPGSLAVSSLN